MRGIDGYHGNQLFCVRPMVMLIVVIKLMMTLITMVMIIKYDNFG